MSATIISLQHRPKHPPLNACGDTIDMILADDSAFMVEQTFKATSEISVRITQIQPSTGHVVTSVGGITGRICEISGVATLVEAAVEEQGAATQEIVWNVSRAAMDIGKATSNIAGVTGTAEEIGAAASQVLGTVSQLSREAETLTAEVERFLATVRAG